MVDEKDWNFPKDDFINKFSFTRRKWLFRFKIVYSGLEKKHAITKYLLKVGSIWGFPLLTNARKHEKEIVEVPFHCGYFVKVPSLLFFYSFLHNNTFDYMI